MHTNTLALPASEEDPRLVSVGHAIERAFAEKSRKQKKSSVEVSIVGDFDPNHFVLPCDPSQPLITYARQLGMDSNDIALLEQKCSSAVASIQPFCLTCVDEVMSATVLMNRPGPRSCHRSANARETLSFIAGYTEIARSGRVVCVNSGIMSDDFPRPVRFTASSKGFDVLIDRKDRMLYPGDLVIMKK